MRPRELMIGDYVIRKNVPNEILIVDTIDSIRDIVYLDLDGLGITEKIENIEPIPLTAEILEKNGFTGGEYKSWTGDVWYLEEEGFRKIGLTMSRKESTLWGEKIKPLYPDSIGHKFAVPNIKFVHQLQHSLRLCGINKEIEI
jgi:hypothetical protein